MTALAEFLAGDRPGDVALFLADAHLGNADALGDHAERVDGGHVLVLPGERARRVFPTVAGDAPMAFARAATQREGTVDRDLAGGRCPERPGEQARDDRGLEDSGGADAAERAADDGAGASAGGEHAVRFVLAFAQGQTEGVGGPYEAGDVVHAYAQCACGTAYSDRWVVGENADG